MNIFFCCFSSIVKSKFRQSSIELDMRSPIDSLLKCLEDEINAKIGFSEGVTNEGEKMDIEIDEYKNEQDIFKIKEIFSNEQQTDQIILKIFN